MTAKTDYKSINLSFDRFMKNNQDARTYVFYGGTGSGKSVFVMQFLLIKTISEGANVLILRKWGEVVRESVIVPFQSVVLGWGIDWDTHYHKTERRLTIGTGRIVFGGLDNVEKFKGTNWDYIWVEEATDITEADLNQLNLRLGRDSENAKLILTFNPIDANHWIVRRFVQQHADSVAVHHSTYRDNLMFLSKTFINEVENLINVDENFYRVYNLGEPGILQNLIYTNWRVSDNAPILPKSPVCAGLDFGYNNPTALVYIYEHDSEIWVEERLYQSYMTNADLIEFLKENHAREITIYADSAEPQRIEEIRRAGFNIIQAEKPVKHGIDFCKSMKLVITSNSGNIIKEIQGYRWKEDKSGVVLDEPVKISDHAMDAMRYAVYSEFGRGSQTILDLPQEMMFF